MKKNQLKSLLRESTLDVARGLLGCRLITRVHGAETSGMIVEVEGYHGTLDEAAHSFGRRTRRNDIMFGRPGFCYVYFIYGMHYCANIVTEEEGTGAAVLFRALEPLTGIEEMQKRRGLTEPKKLCSGPAKLCEALAIDRQMLGEDMLSSQLISIEPYTDFDDSHIGKSKRIGISKAQHLEWRFFVRGNGFVSR